MNSDRVHGILRQVNGKLKEQWGTLTDNPLIVAAGTRDQRVGRIEERRGISKQVADRQLEEFLLRNRNWRDLSRR